MDECKALALSPVSPIFSHVYCKKSGEPGNKAMEVQYTTLDRPQYLPCGKAKGDQGIDDMFTWESLC